MYYISAENLTKSYGIEILFDGISFYIDEGDGEKSIFLKILKYWLKKNRTKGNSFSIKRFLSFYLTKK